MFRVAWRPLAAEILSVAVPLDCAGCGKWDTALCRPCHRALQGKPVCSQQSWVPPGIPGYAAGAYSGPLRKMILRWKHATRADVEPHLLAVARRAGLRAARGLAEREPGQGRQLWVIPAPSGWLRKLRGRFVVGKIADEVGRALAVHPGVGQAYGQVRVVDCLRQKSRGQKNRSGRQRRLGRRVDCLLENLEGIDVVIVDDVATTGATLGACVSAVSGTGARVVAVTVLAQVLR